MNYVPLYVKTEYSLLHSLIRINDYIKFALDNNLKALTICDDNLSGVMEFYKECKKNNIKPVIGLCIRVENQELVLYAKNNDGYKNLLKLSTLASDNKLDLNVINDYSDNLICIIPVKSIDIYNELKKVYQDIYIGYSTNDEKEEYRSEKLVYMNECLSLTKEDTIYLNYLHSIKKGVIYDEVKENNVHKYIHLNADDNFNNKTIIDDCNVEILYQKDLLPVYECENNNQYEYLKKLCIEGLRKKFGNVVGKEYAERLKYELNVINNMGFCNYFLVVYDYVKFAKDNNILVGPGRGSAAGSLVSYLLNITEIDPIKYNLLFERFLNPERVTMPDIDIDFEDDRRDEVIDYCINKYGYKKVAGIVAFGTLASKQVIRDVGRSMDISIKTIDYLAKMLDAKMTLRENYKSKPLLKDYIEGNEDIKKLYKVALKLEGLKRHTTIHAAGIVMANKDLDNVIPLLKSSDDRYLTGFSMEHLEELGLLKMDFLALKNLSLISNIIRLIEENENKKIDFNSIPLNDSKALNIFSTANTVGIFQFESTGMKNFLKKLKPNSFHDICAAIALFRPGPMDNIDTYIRRKYRYEKINYIDDSLKDILKDTYGIIIYQEQIMQIASKMAKFSFGEADILRRAMSKKKENILLKEKDKFIRNSIDNGYSREVATKVYDMILKFASYGFNKSHSVAYSMIAYKMAYLKAYYPKYFCAGLLSNATGSEIKTREYIYESKLNNIDILKPNINLSEDKYVITDKGIIYPLTGIKNVGFAVAKKILENRTEPFKDIYDFMKRCYSKTLNKKAIISLIDAGVFDSFNINHNTLVNNLDNIINYSELISELDEDFVEKPIINEYEEYSKLELMNREYDVFGFYLSKHPVTEARLKHNNSITLTSIPKFFDRSISIIVMIDRMKSINTKNNQRMCFLSVSDEVSTIDAVLFPKVYEKNMNIKEGQLVLIKGKVEKRFDKYQIICNTIDVIEL